MSSPTKSMALILLADYSRMQSNCYSASQIEDCFKKGLLKATLYLYSLLVITIQCNECVSVDKELSIKPYFAGHALGACMYLLSVACSIDSDKTAINILYTGDFNKNDGVNLQLSRKISNNSLISDSETFTTVPIMPLDLLICESTYASTIRDGYLTVNREFVQYVLAAINRSAKVLIPVFALGKAQELCLLLENAWERMGINVPIFIAPGLSQLGTEQYQLMANWTKADFVSKNPFSFKYVCQFPSDISSIKSPCVLFATPGMLHGGLSLEVFKLWAPDPKNCILFPGYCADGTIGHKVLQGAKKIVTNGFTIHVKCDVVRISFTAHSDANGLMQIIGQCRPNQVVLVHGQFESMDYFSKEITSEFGTPCHCPDKHQVLSIPVESKNNVLLDNNLFEDVISKGIDQSKMIKIVSEIRNGINLFKKIE